MKFKYPKQITIGDSVFHIKYDSKYGGGNFNYPSAKKRGLIRIGTSNIKTNPIRVLNIFMHEVKEIIHVEQATRYDRNDNGEYEFHYTHKEHTDLVARLAAAVDAFIK